MCLPSTVLADLWVISSRAFSPRKSFLSPNTPFFKAQTTSLTATSDYIARLDGATEIDGGWLNQNYIQLAYQLADSVTGMAYSFFGTCIILFLINLIPGLQLRASGDAEIMGIDDAELGEFAVRLFPSPHKTLELLTDISVVRLCRSNP